MEAFWKIFKCIPFSFFSLFLYFIFEVFFLFPWIIWGVTYIFSENFHLYWDLEIYLHFCVIIEIISIFEICIFSMHIPFCHSSTLSSNAIHYFCTTWRWPGSSHEDLLHNVTWCHPSAGLGHLGNSPAAGYSFLYSWTPAEPHMSP
jgi:hypothetical protein